MLDNLCLKLGLNDKKEIVGALQKKLQMKSVKS